MAFDVTYRYCDGAPTPMTEVVLDSLEDDPIILAPDEYGEDAYHIRVGGGDGDPFYTFDDEELNQFIAELQRMRAGCFSGEWPRPEVDTAYRPPFQAPCPNCDPELRRLLDEEAEIERRTRAAVLVGQAPPNALRQQANPAALPITVTNHFHAPPTCEQPDRHAATMAAEARGSKLDFLFGDRAEDVVRAKGAFVILTNEAGEMSFIQIKHVAKPAA